MIFDLILERPSYGYERDGKLYIPSRDELWREFFLRVNPLLTRKNWLPFLAWTVPVLLEIPMMLFLFRYFTWTGLAAGFVYGYVFLPMMGTVWLHRYSSHRAYSFSHPFWRFVVKNLAIKIVPEEVYAISHHVHHAKSEQPGDPYNAGAGWWYCFLADAIHNLVSRDLSPGDYDKACRLFAHTGIRLNSFEQYRQWGTLSHPARTVLHFALNWAFWFAVFFAVGGVPLAVAIFGMTTIWAWGVRMFNFQGHGSGRDQRLEGRDFHRGDLSINRAVSGWFAGEWHNNHHLYPNGARSGFLPHQPDTAWWFIRGLCAIGAVSSYKDFTPDFYRDHYEPFVAASRRS